MSRRISPHQVLGVAPTATRDQIKESFRKLCMEWHPDRCPEHMREEAGLKFKQIKEAYDAILRGRAGYNPPPPGTAPSYAAAEAYAKWHKRGGVKAPYSGPVKPYGPYGGYNTELQFYRAMFKGSGDSPVGLIFLGLAAIPLISGAVNVWNGNIKFVQEFKNYGLNYFSGERWRVNGRETVVNPYSIRSLDEVGQSYIYKYEKYRHLRPMYDKYRKQEDEEPVPAFDELAAAYDEQQALAAQLAAASAAPS